MRRAPVSGGHLEAFGDPLSRRCRRARHDDATGAAGPSTGEHVTVKPRRRSQRGSEGGGVAQLPAGIPYVLPSFIVSQRVAERRETPVQLICSPPD